MLLHMMHIFYSKLKAKKSINDDQPVNNPVWVDYSI